MNQIESDECTMQRVARGDKSALGELMRRWATPIRAFIGRMCRSLHCCEDIHQEVWTRLFLYRKQYNPSKPFRSYLFTIAVNCCRSALSRSRTRREYLRIRYDDLDRLPGRANSPPVDNLINQEQSIAMHMAISELPLAQRTVVLLYFLCDSDYGQIAKILKKSRGTVRSHMHHALRKLRATLTGVLEDAEIEVDHD